MSSRRMFGRERSVHEILGSGKGADILLWRNKALSGAVFLGMMTIWFLFEVAEYNILTLCCHFTITAMLVIFIWSNGARALNWTPPDIPMIQLEESMLYTVSVKKLNILLPILIESAYGVDIIRFCLTIVALMLLAMLGSLVSMLNLCSIVMLCMGTLPCLYERYEKYVDYLLEMMDRKAFQIYEMLDRNLFRRYQDGLFNLTDSRSIYFINLLKLGFA